MKMKSHWKKKKKTKKDLSEESRRQERKKSRSEDDKNDRNDCEEFATDEPTMRTESAQIQVRTRIELFKTIRRRS